MGYLLDTHVLLWWLFDSPRLSATARGLIMDAGNDIYVSGISALEVTTKHRLGKLDSAATLVQDFDGWIKRAGFRDLAVTSAHSARAGLWPQPHRDPFDRLLAAQSVIEDLPLISRDKAIAQFGVTLIW